MGNIADFPSNYTLDFTAETYNFTLYIWEGRSKKWCAKFHHNIFVDGYKTSQITSLYNNVDLVCNNILEIGWEWGYDTIHLNTKITCDEAIKFVRKFALLYKNAVQGPTTRSRKRRFEGEEFMTNSSSFTPH